jgi:hypothetical protein
MNFGTELDPPGRKWGWIVVLGNLHRPVTATCP